ncbi:MAG: Hypothetical protein AJITA_00567 [Acetilactobacillus jinshanensis]
MIDYKSSPHSFDYGQIYAGTQMQMMTYLDVLYYVFGALYSLIQDPFLKPLVAKIQQAKNGEDK